MFDNLTQIVSVDELAEATTNKEIENLCSTEPNTVKKYINQVTAKVRAKIDKEQFKVWESYDIPDDLKLATIWLIDSYYVYSVKNWQSVATWKRTSYSETIDDYKISETYSETTSAFDYFWIPIDQYSLTILMSYMDDDSGVWNINLH